MDKKLKNILSWVAVAVAAVAVGLGFVALIHWIETGGLQYRTIEQPNTDVYVLKIQDEVVEVWTTTAAGKPIPMRNDVGEGQVHIQRTYYLENFTANSTAVVFACYLTNESDAQRKPIRKYQNRMQVLRPRQHVYVTLWFEHFTDLVQVYYLRCNWEQIDTDRAVMRL